MLGEMSELEGTYLCSGIMLNTSELEQPHFLGKKNILFWIGMHDGIIE